MVAKVHWDLVVDIADNGSMVVLKCLNCREKFAHVFLGKDNFWVDVNVWKKDIIDKHLLKHTVEGK